MAKKKIAGLRYHLATCYGPSSGKPVGGAHCVCSQDRGRGTKQKYTKKGCAFRYWSAKTKKTGRWRFLDDTAFKKMVRGAKAQTSRASKGSRVSATIKRVKRERKRR